MKPINPLQIEDLIPYASTLKIKISESAPVRVCIKPANGKIFEVVKIPIDGFITINTLLDFDVYKLFNPYAGKYLLWIEKLGVNIYLRVTGKDAIIFEISNIVGADQQYILDLTLTPVTVPVTGIGSMIIGSTFIIGGNSVATIGNMIIGSNFQIA